MITTVARCMLLALSLTLVQRLRADEGTAPAPTQPETAAPRIVVILPEQIDTEWFWFYHTDEAQHIVQSAVEKALIREGMDVIDVTTLKELSAGGDIQNMLSLKSALATAKEAGATYAIVGKATASMSSRDVAYGVTVIRSAAEITAKLVRVSDAKTLGIEEASATAGGQAQKAAGREALKEAADKLANQMLRLVRQQLSPPATTTPPAS